MNNIATIQPDSNLLSVLKTSLYPGAADSSIAMVVSYCKAAGLDPMQKPVHIVPMWDGTNRVMRDVIMPGIGLYRIQAARTGEYAGVSDPEFGPDVSGTVGGQEIVYPQWCRVTVRRIVCGTVCEFTAREFWLENYAVKGGKEKSTAPNTMWSRRPYGQLAKCAEAQALRKAFPELGAQPAAEEMEGKSYIQDGDYFEDAVPGIDISPEINAIKNAPNMVALHKEFEAAWIKHPQARAQIAKAKDERKSAFIAMENDNEAG